MNGKKKKGYMVRLDEKLGGERAQKTQLNA
jgi:hypothetical protein